MILPEFTLIHCPRNDLFTFGTGHNVWLPKRSSDTRTIHVPPRETVSRWPKPTAPGRGNTRPRVDSQNSTAAAFKTLLRWFQNSLPVGYITKRKDFFLPPHFSKLLEDSRGGWSPHAHGLFPVSTSPKASRMFSQWLTSPNARSQLPAYKLLEASIEMSFTPQSKDG
jgi:hypothetical protein